MTAGDNRLPVLAREIGNRVRAARRNARAALWNAMKAGDALIEAKELVKHGEWLDWLRENCELSERTASRYMQLARHREGIEIKSATVADLTIRGALAEVVEPRWPDAPSKLTHVLRCIPSPGMAKTGILATPDGGTDFFWIIESETVPDFYFIGHCWVPDDFSGGTISEILRRPIRADAVHEVVKLHSGENFLGIDFRDVPAKEIAWLLQLGEAA
jgi:hypothetical protein